MVIMFEFQKRVNLHCNSGAVTESILLASSIFPNNEYQITDAYSEPCQTSKMEYLLKKNSPYTLTIFAKHSILDVWQMSEYTSVLLN